MKPPILWQFAFSHYNEKVRWALDYKRIPHRRRSLLPGPHLPIVWWLSRGQTTPVLRLEGKGICDSTRIIEALEHRWPKPPLHPADEAECARALALEDYFDDVGHELRRALLDETLHDRDLSIDLFTTNLGPVASRAARVLFPVMDRGVRREKRIDPASAEKGRAEVLAALDRIESELQPSGYLVGESFSVADLTAASILFPLAKPPEFPYPLPDAGRFPASVREFRESQLDRPAVQWILDMYRLHRGASTELGAHEPAAVA